VDVYGRRLRNTDSARLHSTTALGRSGHQESSRLTVPKMPCALDHDSPERDLFRLLSQYGEWHRPQIALSILSGSERHRAPRRSRARDIKSLSKISGVGVKRRAPSWWNEGQVGPAGRGKHKHAAGLVAGDQKVNDAVLALIALGLSRSKPRSCPATLSTLAKRSPSRISSARASKKGGMRRPSPTQSPGKRRRRRRSSYTQLVRRALVWSMLR